MPRTRFPLLQRGARILLGAIDSYRPRRAGRKHPFDAELIISLTSYPPRYRTLGRTLRCLLRQSVAADRIILWVTEKERALLPRRVLKLTSKGLTIRNCPQWRSLKKIAPALINYPGAYIVTADDDLHYSGDWLEQLIKAFDGRIVARAARNPLWCDDHYLPVPSWPVEGPDGQLYCLSGAGVLYPPGSLHPDVIDYDRFARLTPTCDDIWLAWQAARAGSNSNRAGPPMPLVSWERTTANSLSHINYGADFEGSGHDQLVANLVREYGPLHCLK